jgi:hypothetical protein
MPSSSDKVIQLRQLLAERFGHGKPTVEEIFQVGLPAIDEIGIPRAALTEIVSSPSRGPGGGLLLYSLLHTALRKGERALVVDGKAAFAPEALPQAELNRLLWTRCREAWEAIKVADLAVRDGNVPLVILLLTLNPPTELRSIPVTAWHRLQMLAEKSAVTLLIFTAQPQVGCARLRLSVGGAFPLDKLHVCRDELLPALEVRVDRRRVGAVRGLDEKLRRASCA